MTTTIVRLSTVLIACALVSGEALVLGEVQSPAASTFAARRAAAMARAGNGLWLIRAVPTGVIHEHGLRQDPLFFYLTGLENAVGAVLVLDADRRESRLFVPVPGQLRGFLSSLQPPFAYVDATGASVKDSGLTVAPWSEFEPFIDGRLKEDKTLVLRGPFRDKMPNLTAAIVGQSEPLLWEAALRARWPNAPFAAAPDANGLRSIKDAHEIATLRRVAEMSAAALRAGLKSVRAGRRQRESESDVVKACTDAGANGISFWPWIQSGRNSAITTALQSLADYRYLDRVMQRGELVRIDVGCEYEHYQGDVGRTAPVSGRFDAGQREAWDVFVAAYRAALAALRPGATSKEVFAIWQNVFRDREARVQSDFARRTVAAAVSSTATQFWQIHGVGLGHAEGLVAIMQAGQVVAFEPILTVDQVGLYLEDMVLITATGAEVLTTKLPYTAAEIETAMRR